MGMHTYKNEELYTKILRAKYDLVYGEFGKIIREDYKENTPWDHQDPDFKIKCKKLICKMGDLWKTYEKRTKG